MSTLHFKKTIPFDTVLLHGIVRDDIGRKMSKSLGNSPDPIDIIDKVGADALRFSMVFNTPKGADVVYSDAILETGRNFANKIWNAYRFIAMGTSGIEGLPAKDELKLELADRWIISRLNEVAKEAGEHYENLRLNDAAQCIFQFLWDEYCSWYIELSKDRLSDDASHQEKLTAKYVLLDVMQAGMRLLHPIMPFISEEIWQSVKEQFPMEDEALIIADFPVADDELIDKDIADGMKFVQESITAIRNLRKQLNLSPALGVKIYVRTAEDAQNKLFEDYAGYFARLARVEEIHSGKDTEKPKPAVSAVVRNIEIFIPLAGLIDPEIEKARLMKQLERHEKELMSVQRKLNNPKFVENAKPEIVAREREREEENKIKVELVKAQIADFD